MSAIGSDKASIMALRDDSSVLSRCSTGKSLLSVVFAFDRQLFTTRVYERALRTSVKNSVRNPRDYPAIPGERSRPVQRTEAPAIAIEDTHTRSSVVTRVVVEYSEMLARECRVVIFGDGSPGEPTIIDEVRSLAHTSSTAERTSNSRRQHQKLLMTNVQRIISDINDRRTGLEMDGIKACYQFIAARKTGVKPRGIAADFAEAVEEMRQKFSTATPLSLPDQSDSSISPPL